jgi:hypothetical protein
MLSVRQPHTLTAKPWFRVDHGPVTHRDLLMPAYVAAWMGRQAGRATGGLLVEMIGLIMSMALVIVAAALPATSSSLVGAKVRSIPRSAASLTCVRDRADWALLQLHHRRDHRGVGSAPQEAPQAGADGQSGRAIRRVHAHHPVSLQSTRTA